MRELIDHMAFSRSASVRKEVWGHLAPKPLATYEGYIVFAIGEYRDVIVVKSFFRSEKAGILASSPWYFHDEEDFVQERAKRLSVGIFRFEGTYVKQKSPEQDWRNAPYKFTGTVRRLEMK